MIARYKNKILKGKELSVYKLTIKSTSARFNIRYFDGRFFYEY